jgi:hypothetical protein
MRVVWTTDWGSIEINQHKKKEKCIALEQVTKSVNVALNLGWEQDTSLCL